MKRVKKPSYFILLFIFILGFIAFAIFGYRMLQKTEDAFEAITEYQIKELLLEPNDGIYLYVSDEVEFNDVTISNWHIVVQRDSGNEYIEVSFEEGDLSLIQPESLMLEIEGYTPIGILYSEEGTEFFLTMDDNDDRYFYSTFTEIDLIESGTIGLVIVAVTILIEVVALVLIVRKRKRVTAIESGIDPNNFTNETDQQENNKMEDIW